MIDSNRGYFITFEGGEGSGKSTQAQLLADALSQNQGLSCLKTREPGGSEGGEAIRSLLVNGENERWDPMSELLLHFAARRDHVQKIIEPALAAGRWVICDRFTDSSIAYQGFSQGISINLIEKLHYLAIGDIWPDVTFILDICAKEGLRRAGARGNSGQRYENMGLEFHNKLRAGYIEIARNHPERCKVIDARQKVESIHRQVWSIIQSSSR